jgi:MFS family permease
MTIPAFAIACLPTTAHIGVLAPILLLIFRIMQGLALGGEIPAAITFVSEHVDRHQHGFATASLFFGINLGLLLGSLVTMLVSSLLSTEALYSYGWRIPFFLGGIFGIISIFLRRYLQETIAFAALEKHEISRIPLATLLKHSWPKVIQGSLLVALASVTVFLYLYWPTYLHQYGGFKLSTVLTINTLGIFVFAPTIILAGWLADRFGFRLIYMIGAALTLILTYPLFLLFGMKSLVLLIVAHASFSVIFGIISGSYPAILSNLFPTPVRYSGIAVSYNLAFAIFGGLSPIICTIAIYSFHTALAPAFYLMLVAFVSLLVCRFSLSEKKPN